MQEAKLPSDSVERGVNVVKEPLPFRWSCDGYSAIHPTATRRHVGAYRSELQRPLSKQAERQLERTEQMSNTHGSKVRVQLASKQLYISGLYSLRF